MWENTVITNAGIELLKNALSGGTITVTAIKSGACKVDVSALKSQTAVSSIKQSGTVQGVTKTNETIKIGVLFSNAGLSAGYSMTQLGIYAKGSTGSEVLFAISQSTTGKEVPAESAMPSWSLVHNFYIKLNNDVTMTATVDPEGYVTFETMQTALNTHTGNKSNPHSVTKSQVGLGNVPNVATNDQTPTYSDTTTLVTLSSGEKISIAFAKIKLAITTLINHLANKSNPHGVTKSQVGLGNVENKSSATIRGELTKGNVTTALGYTPPTQDTNTWRGIQNNLTSDATDQSLSAAQGKVLNTNLTRHTGNKTNPHGVTKSQIGLGNVENKSSATIRSEITDANVETALGFTPANQTDMTNAQDAITQLNSDFTFDERSVSSGGLFVKKNKDVVIVSSYFSGNLKGGNTDNVVSLPDGVNFTTALFAPCEVLDTNWTPVGNSGYISVNRNQLTIRCKETMNGVVIANLVAPAAHVQFN